MTANKFKIKVGKKDQDIRIPLQLTFEETGRGDLIKEYEDDVLRKLINPTKDFEVTRYNHMGYDCSGASYIGDVPINNAKIAYAFAFENAGVWNTQYNLAGWSNLETFRKVESLKNSFFKLDLYDTPYRRNQQLYVSLIITPFTGQEEILTVAYPDGTTSTEFLKVPQFVFGPNTTDVKENFYIYWLKEIVPDLDIFDFYMTAKFFDGKTGDIRKFTVLPQNISGTMSYTLPESFFYYHVELDHPTKSYKIKRIPNGLGLPPFANEDRIGLWDAPLCSTETDSPDIWFEYANPL